MLHMRSYLGFGATLPLIMSSIFVGKARAAGEGENILCTSTYIPSFQARPGYFCLDSKIDLRSSRRDRNFVYSCPRLPRICGTISPIDTIFSHVGVSHTRSESDIQGLKHSSTLSDVYPYIQTPFLCISMLSIYPCSPYVPSCLF